jgi:succinyl-diaminopimelate desuccinylase
MHKEILPLTKRLVALHSEAGNPAALVQALQLAVRQVPGFTIRRFSRRGVKSLLVSNASPRTHRFRVLLNAHLDVVPGKPHQYRPKQVGNRLYGVGAMDMKGSTACLLLAFREVAKTLPYPLALQLVTDEEVGGFDGTKLQVEKGIRADFVIAGEATSFDIVNQAKGVLIASVTAKGKTAHGAYPWRGDNAIAKIQEFLNRLDHAFPVPARQRWISTVNVSTIRTSNEAFNKVPDDCTVGLDIRCIPEDAVTIVRRIRSLLPKGCTLQVAANEPALQTPANHPDLLVLRRTVRQLTKKNPPLRPAQGTSDARHFARVGCPGIEFGPVGGAIGSDHEWVDIPSLDQYYRMISQFLRSLDRRA